METQNNYNVDKLEFRQIVLGHIKRILEIGSHELRDTTRQIDTAIQAIENLAYVLIPYFDDEILQVYERCERIINGFGYEVRNILNKTFERIKKETGKENLENVFVLEMRLRYSKKLFIALNMLLKRNDYLKSAIYGEEKDEVAQDNEESEE